ncbi:MAG: NAD-dependent epimerase/dehydratase family protein [Polyangia bacterium]
MPTPVFVLGATGFIGERALHHLVASRDLEVSALARSPAAAARIEAAGAKALLGALDKDGDWQRAVAKAEVVVHAAQPQTFGKRITAAVARRYEADRLALDGRLFAALPGDRRTRLVYVSGNSFYGETGTGAPLDETMTPHPTGFGPYIVRAVEAVERLHGPNREVIAAFPGAVYGRGSWMKQFFIDPIAAGKKVMRLSGPPHWASPIHVDDCGRALAHLVTLRSPERRYFLVDDEPKTYDDLARTLADVMRRPLKIQTIPGFMLGLFAGQIIRSYMQTDSRYSNRRLRASGFEPKYPTIATGIPALFAGDAPAVS